MKLSSRQRRGLLGALFTGAAWLAVFGDKTPAPSGQGVVGPSPKPVAQPVARPVESVGRPARGTLDGSTSSQAPPRVLSLAPRDALIRRSPAAPIDLFSPRNWTPPPPPMAPVPVAAPTAPPLPYAYVGKKQQDGQWEVYLARGEMTYIVRQGASLEGTYSVERIEPPTMTLKYRPLGQAQSLVIGE